jgi:hypothetical protein
MAFGSGLAAQFGYAAESTVGTQVTVDHFLEHKKADFELEQNWAVGEGLRVSGQVPRTARTIQTTRGAKGSLEVEVPTSKFGLMLRHVLGSPVSTATLVSGSAYKQVHQLGNAAGLGLTMQRGVPQTDGTVKPYTYTGCKFASWEFSCEEGGLLMFNGDVDAKDELTLATSPASNALAAASYVAATELFTFHQAVIKTGGTASTASSEVSIAAGVALPSLVRSFSLKGTTPLASERFGTSQTKREQLQNGVSDIRLTLDAEFGAQADLYDVFRAGTVVPIEITFTGSSISGGNNTFSIILAATKYMNVKAEDNEADLVGAPLELRVLDDGTNNPCQIKIISTDTTL